MPDDEAMASIQTISSECNSLATLPASTMRIIINFALEDKWWFTLQRITGMKQVKAYCFIPRVCRGMKYLHASVFLPRSITIKFWQHGWKVYNPTDSSQVCLLLEEFPTEWMVCCRPKVSPNHNA